MIAEDIPPPPETVYRPVQLIAANDSVGGASATLDARILEVARAMGRQIAREAIEALQAANDNKPEDET